MGLEVCIGQNWQGFGSGVAAWWSLWEEIMDHPVSGMAAQIGGVSGTSEKLCLRKVINAEKKRQHH